MIVTEQKNDKLTHSEARRIAEAMWGKGGTNSDKMTRNGIFSFSCSSHGGIIASWNSFSEDEKSRLLEYGFKPETATRAQLYRRFKISKVFAHPYMTRSKTYTLGTNYDIPFVVFEEDCNWSAVYVLTGVRFKRDHRNTKARAQEVFDRWVEKKKVG